ncbi:MAG: DUF6036 family nucleotidyltransferase [Pseudomonadota bacterium]
MDKPLDDRKLNLAFESLAIRLEENNAQAIEIVICGGSALILTGKVLRTTKDVDVVALINDGFLCLSPSRRPHPRLLKISALTETGSTMDRAVERGASFRWGYRMVFNSGFIPEAMATH